MIHRRVFRPIGVNVDQSANGVFLLQILPFSRCIKALQSSLGNSHELQKLCHLHLLLDEAKGLVGKSLLLIVARFATNTDDSLQVRLYLLDEAILDRL